MPNVRADIILHTLSQNEVQVKVQHVLQVMEQLMFL